MTEGERLFLVLYDLVGSRVQMGLSGPESILLDEEDLAFLDHSHNFRKFVRLVTSVNLFLRVFRAIRVIASSSVMRALRHGMAAPPPREAPPKWPDPGTDRL